MSELTDQSDSLSEEQGRGAEMPGESPPARKPLRVAWIGGTGTFELFSRTLQPMAMAMMGEPVEIVLLTPEAGVVETVSPYVETIPFTPPHLLMPSGRLVRRIAERVRASRAKLVHALDAGVAHLARKIALAAEVEYIVTSLRLGDGRKLSGASDAAGVLASSQPICDELLSHEICPAERIHLVRPGVYSVRRPTCFSDSSRTVSVVAGGSQRTRGAAEGVLEAFAELRNDGAECMFFFMTNPSATRRLRSYAASLGLAGDVTFVDRQSPMQFTGIIKAADVYISAAPPKHLDISTLLAMSAGSAVVCAADPAADFMIDGETVMLFEQGDSVGLAARLRKLLAEPQTAQSLTRGALDYLVKNHSPSATANTVVGIYREAVS